MCTEWIIQLIEWGESVYCIHTNAIDLQRATFYTTGCLYHTQVHVLVVVANTQVRALRAESWRRVPCEGRVCLKLIYLCGPNVAVPWFEQWFVYSLLVRRRLGRGWSGDIQRWIRLWLRLKFIHPEALEPGTSWDQPKWSELRQTDIGQWCSGYGRFSIFLCSSIEAMFYGYSYPPLPVHIPNLDHPRALLTIPKDLSALDGRILGLNLLSTLERPSWPGYV